jgi:hypothetical protein
MDVPAVQLVPLQQPPLHGWLGPQVVTHWLKESHE